MGARELRQLADQHGIRPTKAWGQNFVVDANTVRRIARLARVGPPDTVLEVGPGLGSLTLALLATGASITAIEVDPALAAALPGTVAAHQPGRAAYLNVVTADALRVTRLPGSAASRWATSSWTITSTRSMLGNRSNSVSTTGTLTL